MLYARPVSANAPAEHHHAEEQSVSAGHELIEAGGPFAPLAFVEIVIVLTAVVLQIQWLTSSLIRAIDADALGAQIKKLVAANNVERAIKLCGAAPNSPITQFARKGLDARLHDKDARALMTEDLPKYKALARSSARLVIVVGAVGLVGSSVLVASGTEKFGEEFALHFGWVPVVIALLVVWNVRWWKTFVDGLELIFRAVCD